MDLQGDPLTTLPIQTGWKLNIKTYLSWQFEFLDTRDHHFGNSFVRTQTQTQSDYLEPLLTLLQPQPVA